MKRWDEDLYLFTPEELARIPEGTVLTCIDRKNYIKGKDYINGTAYGVKDPRNNPLKDLFLIFKLTE